MNFNDSLTKFLAIVLAKDGTIASRRFNQEYFTKHDHHEEWNWFVTVCNSYGSSFDNRDCLWMIRNGIEQMPICKVCGNPSKIIRESSNIYVGEYCSKDCSNSCPDRASKISSTKNSKSKEEKMAITDKAAATMLERHGFAYNLQNPNRVWPKHDLPTETILDAYTNDKLSLLELGSIYGVDYDTIRTRLVEAGVTDFRRMCDYNVSLGEKDIGKFLTASGIEHVSQFPLNEFFVDMFVPEHNLAIEHNGLWVHSCGEDARPTSKSKHYRKWVAAKEHGYKLLQFTDHQWKTKGDICRSMILNACGESKSIYARKCSVIQTNYKVAKEFFDTNHIQGQANASVYYGLELDGVLVACMSIGIPRFGDYDLELIRYATILGHSVVGGFSKILSHIRQFNSGMTMVSYADSMYATGNVYTKNGFEYVDHTQYGYHWTKGKNEYINRMKTQKHKLGKLLGENFDDALTESENMFKMGYRKYFDAGMEIFVLTL